jgi:hypothetical protein
VLAAVAVAVILLFGCRSWKTGRIVRIVDTDQNRPAAAKTFVFFADPELAPLVKVPAPLRVQLDTNGEACVALPRVPSVGKARRERHQLLRHIPQAR